MEGRCETLGERHPETLAAISKVNNLGVLGGNPKPEDGYSIEYR